MHHRWLQPYMNEGKEQRSVFCVACWCILVVLSSYGTITENKEIAMKGMIDGKSFLLPLKSIDWRSWFFTPFPDYSNMFKNLSR